MFKAWDCLGLEHRPLTRFKLVFEERVRPGSPKRVQRARGKTRLVLTLNKWILVVSLEPHAKRQLNWFEDTPLSCPRCHAGSSRNRASLTLVGSPFCTVLKGSSIVSTIQKRVQVQHVCWKHGTSSSCCFPLSSKRLPQFAGSIPLNVPVV